MALVLLPASVLDLEVEHSGFDACDALGAPAEPGNLLDGGLFQRVDGLEVGLETGGEGFVGGALLVAEDDVLGEVRNGSANGSPWERALRLEAALPSGVRGPVDFLGISVIGGDLFFCGHEMGSPVGRSGGGSDAWFRRPVLLCGVGCGGFVEVWLGWGEVV